MGTDVAMFRSGQHRIRQGITFDKWPFRLDIAVEYQDWILVGMCFVLAALWATPLFCARIQGPLAKAFTNWVYSRMHVFYVSVLYVSLFIVMFTVGVLPDWTVDQFVVYLYKFICYTLEHLENMVISAGICTGFYVAFSMRKRIALAAGLDHITVLRWSWRDVIGWNTKRRPVEIFIWKVEETKSASRKLLKANDLFIECHMGSNQPMRTRVHNNAGSGCVVKESFQLNIDESETDTLMTLCVNDQGMMASSEVARLTLSVRELCGIEDQTGKRRIEFTYCEDCFVALSLNPQGKIWIAIAPVDERETDEDTPLMEDDAITC